VRNTCCGIFNFSNINIICSHENYYFLFIVATNVEKEEEEEEEEDEEMADDESVDNPRQDEETKRRLEDEQDRRMMKHRLAIVNEERRKLVEDKIEAQDRQDRLINDRRLLEENRRQAQILKENLEEDRRLFDELRRKTELELVQEKIASREAQEHKDRQCSQLALELAEEKKATKEAKWRLSETLSQFQQRKSVSSVQQQQQQQDLVQQQQQQQDLVQHQQQQEHDRLCREQLVQQQENDRLHQQQQANDQLRREQEEKATGAAALVVQSSAAFVQPSHPKPSKAREYTTARTLFEVRPGDDRKERALDDREGRTINLGVQRDKRINAQINNLSKKRSELVFKKRIENKSKTTTTEGEEVTATVVTTRGEEVTATVEATGVEEVKAAAEVTGGKEVRTAALAGTPTLRRSMRGQRTVAQSAGMWTDIASGALHEDKDQDIVDLILDQGDAAEKAMME
jgi:hypothetical protein